MDKKKKILECDKDKSKASRADAKIKVVKKAYGPDVFD